MIILGGFVLGYSNQVGDKYCREDNLSNGEVCDNLFYNSNIVQVSGRARIFTGIPKVTDGDSLKLGKIRIRLFGIDAPESKQICHHRREEWRCGWEATNALANIVGKHWVSCIEKDIDRYERVIAVCKVGPIDLSAWMVVNGWALAY